MKFRRGCFDKIDWNTWIPDSDVNENKRLQIGSTGSFSGVLLFSFFLFSLFCWLYLKLWISCVNDGRRALFFFLIIMTWQLSQTKTPSQVFVKNTNCLYINCVFWANQARKDRFWIFWIEKNYFRPEKWSFNKSTNNRRFLKGSVQAFCQKFNFLLNFFGGKSSQKRSFLDSLDRKHTF